MLKNDFIKAGLGDIYFRFEEEAFRNIYLKYSTFKEAFNKRLLIMLKPVNNESSIKELLSHIEVIEQWRIEIKCYWEKVEEETLRLMVNFARKNSLI